MTMKRILCLFCACVSLVSAQEIFEETVNPVPSQPPPQEMPVPAHENGTDSISHALTKMGLTLLVLIVLFGVSYYFLRRVGKSRFSSMNNMKAIKVREKRPISPKTTLYLVELAGKEVLIAESQLDVRALATYEWPDEEPLSAKNS